MSGDPVELDLWQLIDPPAEPDPQRTYGAANELRRPKRTRPSTPVVPPSPRDEAAAAAENSLDTRWRLWAQAELDRLIASGEPFTADDLRAVVGDPPDGKHRNGIGGLFLRASKAGRIVMAGYQPSTRREARQRVLRVWRGAA